jgi:hypothetical protein
MPAYGIPEWLRREEMMRRLDEQIAPASPDGLDHDTLVQIRGLIARGWPIRRIAIETGLPMKTVKILSGQ